MKTLIERMPAWRDKFWVIPAVAVAVAVVAAEGMLAIDRNFDLALSRLYDGSAESAQGLLTAVATATLSLAGTLFFITLTALSGVVTVMGPRLLHEFLKDRSIQSTLGIYLATFTYSLLSLRAVRAGGEGKQEHVPSLNVAVDIALALICVVFLIYFIVHIAQSISMSHVVHVVAQDVEEHMRRLIERGEEEKVSKAPGSDFYESADATRSSQTGYLKFVDYKSIAQAAAEEDCAVHLGVAPGDLVLEGEVIAHGVPHMPENIEKHIVVTQHREDASAHDPRFTARHLAEIAARALSTGVNDPYTVIDIIDRFTQILVVIGDKRLPQGIMHIDGEFRLDYQTFSYEQIIEAMFTQIRRDAADNAEIYLSLLNNLAKVVALLRTVERRNVLDEAAEAIYSDAGRQVGGEVELHQLEDSFQHFKANLARWEESEKPGEENEDSES
ncbi:DUF2254 domain-containing protein [Corynebacterium sp. KPL2850]|uniref:DUF2254 domain-containing protein n=1 Tax=Corynebacterium sp. KPL2850 TaxID=3158318 RepID=UPI0032ED639A